MIVEPYCSVEDADAYFEQRLNSEQWFSTSFEDRLKALVDATRRIDRLRIIGQPTSLLQQRKFPRSPDLQIPSDIKIASCEIAFTLLDDIDMEMEIENLNVTHHSYASVNTTYDSTQTLEHIRAGIPSSTAWQILLRWLPDPRAISIKRS